MSDKAYTIAEIKALPDTVKYLNGSVSFVITESEKPFKGKNQNGEEYVAYKYKVKDDTGDMNVNVYDIDLDKHIGKTITFSGMGIGVKKGRTQKGFPFTSLNISSKADIAVDNVPPKEEHKPDTSGSTHSGPSDKDAIICRQTAGKVVAELHMGEGAKTGLMELIQEAEVWANWFLTGTTINQNPDTEPF